MKKLTCVLAIMVAASTPAFAQVVLPGHTGTPTPSGTVPGGGVGTASTVQGLLPPSGGVNNAQNGQVGQPLPNGVIPGAGVLTATPH